MLQHCVFNLRDKQGLHTKKQKLDLSLCLSPSSLFYCVGHIHLALAKQELIHSAVFPHGASECP